MIRRRALASVCLFSILCVFSQTAVRSQDVAQELRLGTPVETDLAGGETHSYRVKLEPNQFMFAAVEQRGIDVMITTFDPDGNQIEVFDTPNGRRGIEPVSITAEIAGDYRLEIRAFSADADSGRYGVKIEKLQAAATTSAGQVDQLLLAWDRPGSPGVAVGVVSEGEAVYQRGSGRANLEYDIPITPLTVFDIASVSKQFTGLAIAMLADKGAIDLDADYREYLPEMPDFGPTVTVRHLVHHTSGIRDWASALPIAGLRFEDVIEFEDILNMARNQRDLNFEPGAEYLYSNTGYNLLAEIVSRVTGEPFPEWMETKVFNPMGMTSTHFQHDYDEIVEGRAASYSADPDLGFKNVVNSLTALGSSSLFTTVEDLAKWVINYEDGRVGGMAAVDLTHQRGILNNGQTISYAFGHGVGRYRGLENVSHGGSWAGFRTYLMRFPEQRLAVIVLSNVGYFNPNALAQSIADIYLADEFTVPLASAQPQSQRQAIAIDPAVLDDYVGTYQLGRGWLLTITNEAGKLMAQATNEAKFPMTAIAENRFWVEDYGAAVLFPRNPAGEVKHIQYRGIHAPRVELFSPDPEELGDFEGRYYSKELETAYTIMATNGQLFAQHRRYDDVLLTPTVVDEFVVPQWFLRNIEFTRDAGGQVTGLRVTNGRVRNLLFVRQAE